MEIFNKKSYFYRKVNGLPPADLDDDPDSADNGAQAHRFEEPEEKEDNVRKDGGMDVNTGDL